MGDILIHTENNLTINVANEQRSFTFKAATMGKDLLVIYNTGRVEWKGPPQAAADLLVSSIVHSLDKFVVKENAKKRIEYQILSNLKNVSASLSKDEILSTITQMIDNIESDLVENTLAEDMED